LRDIPESGQAGVVLLPDSPEYRSVSEWALREARRILKPFLKGTGIRVFLFGSRARGKAKRSSDIDIALSSATGSVPGTLTALLSEAFENSRIPYHVDIVDLDYAGLELKQAIEKEGVEWTD